MLNTVNNQTLNFVQNLFPTRQDPCILNTNYDVNLEILKNFLTSLDPPSIALARDKPDMRDALNQLTPTDLKQICLPTDIDKPVSQDIMNIIKPMALNDNGTLTELAQQVISGSPYATARDLSHLALSEICLVREAVAKNSNTPGEILRKLTQDPEPAVRIALANNLNTPPEILQILVKDPDPEVKKSVADKLRTPRIPFKTLLLLARNLPDDVFVSANVKQNSTCELALRLTCNMKKPLEILETLLTLAQAPNTRAAATKNSRLQSAMRSIHVKN